MISTDSHSQNGLDLMQFGVYQARRAGLEKKDVANTRPLKEFKKLLRRSSEVTRDEIGRAANRRALLLASRCPKMPASESAFAS